MTCENKRHTIFSLVMIVLWLFCMDQSVTSGVPSVIALHVSCASLVARKAVVLIALGRGSSWLAGCWLLTLGAKRHGYPHLAEELVQRLIAIVRKVIDVTLLHELNHSFENDF